jgi:hypothetical protein
MKQRNWAVVVGLVLCATTLAACGGGGGSSSGGGGGGGEGAEVEEAQLEFAECMREHGVEMEDPKPGQKGIVIGSNGEGGGFNPNDPASQEALAACRGTLGSAGQETSSGENEEFEESVLAFAQCMRENGADIPDPQFDSEGHVKMQTGGSSGGASPGSPAFQKAQESCQSKLPSGAPGAP